MQIADWLWNWLDRKKPVSVITPRIDYAARLSSLKLEDRRVLSVTPVLTGGVLDVTMTSNGDTAKISVVHDNQGVASIQVTDQLNQTTSFLASAVDSIEITGAAGTQSVYFQGSSALDLGSLTVQNSVDNVTFQSAVNVHSGAATVRASHDIQFEGNGSLTADDPNSSVDHLNITLSADNNLIVQQLSATGKINLSAASLLTVNDGAAAHDVQAGTGIIASVLGTTGLFVIDSGADVNSLSGGIALNGNRMDLGGTVTAEGQTVSIAPNPVPIQLPPAVSTGMLIDLGTELDGPGYLGLSAAELSNINADVLSIGNNLSGSIVITAAITFPSDIDVTLRTGNNQISFQNGSLDLHGGDLTLRTGNGGSVIADAAGLDVSANTVTILTGLGIGSSGNPLRLDATFLSTNTSNANAGQFLSEFDAVTIATAGLNAGTGTINLVDGLFLTGGDERISNTTSVAVGLDATLDFQGHTETVASLSNQGSVILGAGLVDTGSLSMTGDATLHAVINGTSPATDFSQIEATGPVSLGGASLDLSLNGTLTVGDQFTLVNNVGSAAIQGTFKNLPEGGRFHVGATTFSISYAGGVGGNDIVLTVVATPTFVFLDGSGNLVVADSVVGGNNDQLTIQSDVAHSQYIIHDPVNLFTTNIPGATISPDLHTITVPFSAIPGTQVFVNTYGGDDSLTVDFSLGDFSRSVRYDGGTMSLTGDSFALTGGSPYGSVSHTFISGSAGEVTVTGNALITYASVENTISDSLIAQRRAFSFETGSANVEIVAAGDSLTISSDQSESVLFVNPTNLLSIQGGTGNDVVTVSSVNSNFHASVAIDGRAGTDTINLEAALRLGSSTSAGNVTLTAETVNLGADIETNRGPVGGVVSVTGTSAINLTSSITINTNVATGVDGNINFKNPLNADVAANGRELTLIAGSGSISMQNIGVERALGAFTVSSAGIATLRQVQTLTGGISLSANETRLSGDLTSSGAIVVNSVTTLQDSLTVKSTGGSDIQFKQTVDGQYDLNVETSGITHFDGLIGSSIALRSLTTDSAGSTNLSANVNAVDSITFNNSVTLLGNVVLASQSGKSITFARQIDGPHDLTINTTGVTSLAGVIGSVNSLASLTTNAGGSTEIGASITTSGPVQFNDAVRITSDVTLSSSGGGNVQFGSTVDGPHALIINSAGMTTFSGVVGGNAALASLTTDLSGTSRLLSNIKTIGSIQFHDAVVLGSDVTLSSTGGGQIAFEKTVDGAHALNVNTAGVTRFNGSVGTITVLKSVTTGSAGTTSLNGDMTATGSIRFNDSVILTSQVVLTSQNQGDIRFEKSLNGSHDLIVNTAGVTRFNGPVGAITALKSLTTDSPGSTSINGNIATVTAMQFNDAVLLTGNSTLESQSGGTIRFEKTVDGPHQLVINTSGTTRFNQTVGGNAALASLVTNSVGSTSLNASVTTTGAIQFNDAVTLTADVVISSTGSGAVSFQRTVNGPYDLTVNTDGVTLFNGVVGGVTALSSLTTDGDGSTRLRGNVTASGAIKFNDAVQLLNQLTVTSSGGDTIRFAETVDGAFGLTVVTSGVTEFGGIVGGTTALSALSTDSAGTTQLNANVTTMGDQTYRDRLVLLNKVAMETQSGGEIAIESTVATQGNDLVMSAAGLGDVAVQGAISGGGAVTVKQGNHVTFGTVTVDSLTIEQASQSVRLAGPVETTGSVSVTSSGKIDQVSSVNSGSGISYTATGPISIQNSMTAENDIVVDSQSGSVTVFSAAPINSGNNLKISAGTAVIADAKLTAGNAVDLNSIGTTTLSPDAEINAGSGGVSIQAAALITGANIGTSGGDVSVKGPVQLTNSIEIKTGGVGDIAMTGSVNGTVGFAQNLTLVAGSGNIQVTGNVGNAIRLGEVLIESANDVNFDGSLSASTYQQLQGSGVATFKGAVNTFGAISGTGDGFQFTGSSLRFAPGTSSLDTHGNDVTLTADAITLPTTFVNAMNSTVTIQTLSDLTSIGLGDASQSLNFTDAQLDVIHSENVVIGSETQTAGIKVGTDGPITQIQNYYWKTAGTVTVNGRFELNAGHNFTAQAGTDLIINAGGKIATAAGQSSLVVGRDAQIRGLVATVSGAVNIDVARNTTFGPTGRIESATGDIEITTGTATPGNGFLLMAGGSVIDAGVGRIQLTAEKDITLGQVKTANGTGDAIRITSHVGGIRNGSAGSENVIAESTGAIVTLRAAAGIGSNKPIGADSSLVTRVNALDVINTTSGDIRVHETSGLSLERIEQQGPGVISVHSDGSLTVVTSGDGVTSQGGSILLSADGIAADLNVRAAITTAGGDITLQARHDVRIDSTGPIASNDGHVRIIADSSQIGDGASGQILMQDGAIVHSGTGTILMQADQNITLGQVATFNATSNAVRIISSSGQLVNGGNSAGDNLIANAVGAVTTIQTRLGVGLNQPLFVNLDTLNLTNGSSTIPLAGTGTGIQLSERDSIGIESLVQHNSGQIRVTANENITVGRIAAVTSPNSFVSLESASGAIVTSINPLIPNIAAETLVMRAVTGIGSNAPLLTRIVNVAATNSGSGDIQLANVTGSGLNIVTIDGVVGISHTGDVSGNVVVSNTGSIAVAALVENSSGGNVTIGALGIFSSITVTAPVMASGGNGNIGLTAGRNIDLFDTGLSADIRSEGTGVITLHSGNLVNFAANVIVQSQTGSITNAPPRFVNLQTPQITAGGIATVTGDFGRPGEHNFTVIVNWSDGTFTTQVFENPGQFVFTHFYSANPNPINPSAPIPIIVTVIADPLIHVYGRNPAPFLPARNLDFTTLLSFAPVPGEGLGSFIFDLTPTVKLLHFPEPQAVGDLPQPSALIPTVAQVVEPVLEKDDRGPSAKRKVFFEIGKRNADGTGWEFDEGIELTEDFLEQIFDPALIEQIPDGRYRVQLQEPGETVKRLVIEFEIVNGSIADGTEPMREDLIPESRRPKPDSTLGPQNGDAADAMNPENDSPIQNGVEGSLLQPPLQPLLQELDFGSGSQVKVVSDSADQTQSEVLFKNSGRRYWQEAVDKSYQTGHEAVRETPNNSMDGPDSGKTNLHSNEVVPLQSSVLLVGLATALTGVERSTTVDQRRGRQAMPHTAALRSGEAGFSRASVEEPFDGDDSAAETGSRLTTRLLPGSRCDGVTPVGAIRLNRAARLMRKWSGKQERAL